MERDSSQPDVSVIIVNFETSDLLESCLAAVAGSSGPIAIEVFVVDNASSSFDPARVTRVFPKARVVVNQRNVGFAAANNQVLPKATGRYVLLLNPDTTVETDTLETMVRYMDKRPEVGCATARLVLPNGKLDVACRRAFPTPKRALYRLTLLSRLFPRSRRFAQYNLTYLDETEEAEIDSPCGAFMLVRAEAYRDVGPLDERYFMYGEDIDWAFRIKAAGWRIMYNPGAVAHHIKRASSRQVRQKMIRSFHDAMRIFYGDHYEQSNPGWLSWLVYRGIDLRERLELTVERFNRAGAEGAS